MVSCSQKWLQLQLPLHSWTKCFWGQAGWGLDWGFLDKRQSRKLVARRFFLVLLPLPSPPHLEATIPLLGNRKKIWWGTWMARHFSPAMEMPPWGDVQRGFGLISPHFPKRPVILPSGLKPIKYMPNVWTMFGSLFEQIHAERYSWDNWVKVNNYWYLWY